MFYLLVRDGGREPVLRIEAQNGMEIGRAPENQCVLVDPNVGRKAARIVEESGRMYLEDLGSTNRTAIRGGRKLARGEREILRHGLVIEVGRSSIEIEEQRSAQDDRTDPADATDADATGDAFGEQTMVAPASGASGRESEVRAPPESDFAPTIQDRRSAPPAAAPAPRRPEPAAPVARNTAAPPSPKSPPPPAAKHAAVPAPVPADSTPSASSTADFMGAGSGTQSIRPISGELGALGALATRRARLVIVNEALRRIDRMQQPTMSIGRESGECRIDHMTISQPHAMIRFVESTLSFQIEDRKSRNQTFLGPIALNPKVPQLLPPESLLRFGAIDAVWVVDRDADNILIPPAQYAGAVRYMLAQNQITQEQARAAQEEAKKGEKHVGEALMMAGVISARIWTKAFENGRSAGGAELSSPGKRRVALLTVFAGLVVLSILAWIFRSKLGLE